MWGKKGKKKKRRGKKWSVKEGSEVTENFFHLPQLTLSMEQKRGWGISQHTTCSQICETKTGMQITLKNKTQEKP